MSRRKLVEWHPHAPDRFAIGSADLRLYEISVESKTSSTRKKRNINLISVNSEVQLLRCFQWSPDTTMHNVVAAGLPGGKVVLGTFSEPGGVGGSGSGVIKEFVPRNSRPCNAVAWNPVYQNHLAAALGKVRCDFSTLVWDIHQIGPSPAMNEGGAETVMRPMGELNMSEATVGLSWVPGQPSCLATGTGARWLRIYDLRASDASARKSVLAHSKGVYGVLFDPFHDRRLATFSDDGDIKAWDVRKLRDPLFTVNTGSKSVVQMAWCPTRSGILASISKDDRFVKLWDTKDSSLITSEKLADHTEATIRKFSRPCRSYEATEAVSWVSWHPTREYRLLTVSTSGFVEVVPLHESIPLTWAPSDEVCFAYGRQLVAAESFSPRTTAEDQDISLTMKQRAIAGYSMDMEKNRRLMDTLGDGELKAAWTWLASMTAKTDRSSQQNFPGILSLLTATEPARSPAQNSLHISGDSAGRILSPQRRLCLRMCGWEAPSLNDVISQLEQLGQYGRACAISVFHQDIPRAIASLKRAIPPSHGQQGTGVLGGQEAMLSLVAMGLAGYEGGSPLWRETCLSLKDAVADPYLRAAFVFLCVTGSAYGDVLDSPKGAPQMSLADRIAYACKFLADEELLSYIQSLASQVVAQGSLEGLLLTGLTPLALDLLEHYINRTADVQTAALLTAHVVPALFKDDRAEHWMLCYRQLLDVWQLWHERAQLDVSRVSQAQGPKPGPQVYARCNFCNQSLSMGMLLPAKVARSGRSYAYGRPTSPSEKKEKVSACPSCNKPLPVCAICLLPLGCATPTFGPRAEEKGVWTEGSQRFEEWFSWCQTCRHGGHAKHLLEWFELHAECPVTDCSCQCCALPL